MKRISVSDHEIFHNHNMRLRSDGSIEYEYWHSGCALHMIDGPAVIKYHSDGRVAEELWYMYDKRVPDETVKEMIKSNKIEKLRRDSVSDKAIQVIIDSGLIDIL